jgi:hypothetical protein
VSETESRCGLSDDEVRGQSDFHHGRIKPLLFDALYEKFRPSIANGIGGLGHDGQARPEILAHWKIIECDDGYIPRAFQP